MEDNSGGEIQVQRGKLDSLSVYEITDYELDILEKGSPASVYLNFGIFFASVSLSFLASLLTTDIESNRTFTVFVIIVAVGLAVGGVLLFMWWNREDTVSETIEKVKGRIPSEEVKKVEEA
jgi:NADH:ubiquinone oxidoreductase subunit K